MAEDNMIDPLAIPLPLDEINTPIIEAIPAPEVQMGASVPGNTLYGPGGAPNPADFFMGETGLMGAVQRPYDPATWENLAKNITGAEAPVDLTTGQPIPEEAPLPIAPNIGEALITPETVISKKVGETQTQTALPTAGTTAALGNVKAAATEQDRLAQEATNLAAQAAQNKASIDEMRYAAADQIAQRAEAIYQASQRAMEENRDEVQRIRNQLATTPWTSFWGSKDMGDRIMLGLAVGLGALGQAQVGGQNVAMAVLQSNIDDFNKSQNQKFQALEAQLSNAQNYTVQNQQALKEQFNILAATKIAAYDKLDAQLAAISAKSAVPEARNRAEMARQDLAFKKQKEIFDMEHALDGKLNTTADVLQPMGVSRDPTASIRADGQPMTEAQSKDNKYFVRAAPAVKALEDFEKAGLLNTDRWASARKALMNEGRAGLAGGILDAASAVLQLNRLADIAAAGDPNLQNYMRNLNMFISQKLRLESGASISANDLFREFLTFLPASSADNRSPAGRESNLATLRELRRNELRAVRGAAGNPSRMWFETDAGGQ